MMLRDVSDVSSLSSVCCCARIGLTMMMPNVTIVVTAALSHSTPTSTTTVSSTANM